MRQRRGFSPLFQRGLTLIELMIALALGLVVVLAASGIFLSNQQASRTTTALGGMQDAAVFSFEMLARDIREAGSNPCDAGLQLRSLMVASTGAAPGNDANWHLAWSHPLFGYEGSAAPASLGHEPGTDVLQILRAADEVRTLTQDMAGSATELSFTPAEPRIPSQQPVMICDGEVFALFGSAGESSSAGKVSLAAAGGNICSFFPRPNATVCGNTADRYLFRKFSSVASLHAVRWFTRDVDGTKALFRQVPGSAAEEVIRGVGGLQVEYLRGGSYVTANTLTSAEAWGEVKSVRIRMAVQEDGQSGVGAADNRLNRTVEHVIALRNRLL